MKKIDKNSKLKNLIIDGVMFFLGTFLFAVSVNIFTAPNKLAPGGFIGLATMIGVSFKLDIGMINLLLNVPLFAWAWKQAGFNFIAKSAIATVLCNCMISITDPLLENFRYDRDVMLAAIFGGLIGGLGCALVFMRGGTTGGVDVVASILRNKIRHVSIGNLILIFDGIIITVSMFVFGFEEALYAIISVFIMIKVVDAVLYGTDIGKGKIMFIISPKNKEISKKIMENIGRGVTELKSKGGYMGTEGEVLMCAVNRQQVYKIYDIIYSTDKCAFTVVGDAGEITGEGFHIPRVDKKCLENKEI